MTGPEDNPADDDPHAECAFEISRLQAEVERAFAAGWRTAANWAHRDDLHADVGSPAYLADMAEALSPAKEPP